MSFHLILLSYTLTIILSIPIELQDFPRELIPTFLNDVKARIDKFRRPDSISLKPLIATSIRLVFHDCADSSGICNGCIDPNNIQHSGLEYGAIYPIEQVYKNSQSITVTDTDGTIINYSINDGWNGNPSGINWSNLNYNNNNYIISRTDMWILFGLASLEYSVNLAYQKDNSFISTYNDVCIDGSLIENGKKRGDPGAVECIMPDYLIGRPQCNTSPFMVNDGFFVDSQWGWSQVSNFFKTKFQMGGTSVVALLGAHALGEGHGIKARNTITKENCCGGEGFHGAWQEKGDEILFTNEYYKLMRDKIWIQSNANNINVINPNNNILNNKLQWHQPKPKPTSNNINTNPTNINGLQCPINTKQIGNGLTSDIYGCGLTGCNARYLYTSIIECQQACINDVRCIAFNYAPLNGDKYHINNHVCTLYDNININNEWGPNQIMCQLIKNNNNYILDNLMLNVDMSLFMEFNNDISNCDHPNAFNSNIWKLKHKQCPRIVSSADDIQTVKSVFDKYINDNIIWLYDFNNAWEMITIDPYLENVDRE